MACPEGARRMYGEEMTVEQVINIVVRDAVFYRQSGGGMTLSEESHCAEAVCI